MLRRNTSIDVRLHKCCPTPQRTIQVLQLTEIEDVISYKRKSVPPSWTPKKDMRIKMYSMSFGVWRLRGGLDNLQLATLTVNHGYIHNRTDQERRPDSFQLRGRRIEQPIRAVNGLFLIILVVPDKNRRV